MNIVDEIKNDIKRIHLMNDIMEGVSEPKSVVTLTTAVREIERLQARIDALMLEYCPDEMTPAQIAEWEHHQRVAPNDTTC